MEERMTRGIRRVTGMRARGMVMLCALLLGACSTVRQTPPTADSPKPRPPSLAGRAVLVLPAQPAPGVPRNARTGEVVPGLDAELAYWLDDLGPRVNWKFPPEIRASLERNAMLNIDIDALAVGSFHVAQVKNIGDPLLGDLRRLAALLDARWALVPVAVAYVPRDEGGRAEAALALIDTYGGQVLWYAVMAGEPGREGSGDVAASLARSIAQILLP